MRVERTAGFRFIVGCSTSEPVVTALQKAISMVFRHQIGRQHGMVPYLLCLIAMATLHYPENLRLAYFDLERAQACFEREGVCDGTFH